MGCSRWPRVLSLGKQVEVHAVAVSPSVSRIVRASRAVVADRTFFAALATGALADNHWLAYDLLKVSRLSVCISGKPEYADTQSRETEGIVEDRVMHFAPTVLSAMAEWRGSVWLHVQTLVSPSSSMAQAVQMSLDQCSLALVQAGSPPIADRYVAGRSTAATT